MPKDPTLGPSKPRLPAELKLNLSVDEAALSLGISSRFCRTLIKQGELPSHRFGRRVVISFDELAGWNRERATRVSS